MDVRLYILAGTFALMVVSLITVVVIAVRVRKREKPVSLEQHPAMPPASLDDLMPVDADLRGLEVPVPENSPHAALLRPLAEKPVWEEAVRSTRTPRSKPMTTEASRSDSEILAEQALTALDAADPVRSVATSRPESTSTPPLAAEAAEPTVLQPPASTEFAEGCGRIPELGKREVHRLPSAEEILASLEAEMARKDVAEEPAPAPTAQSVDADPAPASAAATEPLRSRQADALTAFQRTSSGAGVPAAQVQWRPQVEPTEPTTHPAPAAAEDASPAPESVTPSPAVAATTPAPNPSEAVPAAPAAPPTVEPPRPVEAPAPMPEPPAIDRPAAVVRTSEPPVPQPTVEPPADPTAPRPAVRVAGLRVPVDASTEAGGQADDDESSGDVPNIELSSPVEMWFGEHRVGVKEGSATFDRLQRYAATLLDDLEASRDDDES